MSNSAGLRVRGGYVNVYEAYLQNEAMSKNSYMPMGYFDGYEGLEA